MIKNKKKIVVVAMSGGVDSSVAAALLKNQGYTVIGLTMCFNLAETKNGKPSCCGLSGINDARRVCQKLGIRHYLLNLNKDFYQKVIVNFYEEYLSGHTPNPCVRCNQFIKFGILLKKALNLGADFLATGHYAKIVKSPQGYLLKKARDLKKDQSYFLHRLNQEQLKRLIFPLGNFTKPEVRVLAKKLGLNVAGKQDSQEICFLPNGNYESLIRAKAKKDIFPGEIVDRQGKVLGKHKGIAFYTIGQRQGLGIALGYPIYVIDIDPKKNRVIVGSRQEVLGKEFLVKEVNFINQPFKKKIEIKAKIRYNHKESKASVWVNKNKLKVVFQTPQFAITPGQSVVFYEQAKVLGGGIIKKKVKPND